MRNRSVLSIAFCLIVMPIVIRWIADTAHGQDAPTTQPATTKPADELPADSPIRSWFIKLTDPDPKVRDQAKQDLMGIAGDDLPKLRQLVIESRPISPGQTAALRDIVLQSLLASEKYTNRGGTETDPNGTEGPFFLGLQWPIDIDADIRLGVTVDERLPGFPSYRFLRKGDIILGVYLHPTNPLPKQPDWPTPNTRQVSGALESAPRAQDIVLQLVRDGEVINVPIKLAPRPMDANQDTPGSLQAFTTARAERAETYWQENFAPLLGQ